MEVVQLSKQLDLGRAEQVQANMPPGGLADERRGADAAAVEDNASLPSSKLSSALLTSLALIGWDSSTETNPSVPINAFSNHRYHYRVPSREGKKI